MNEKSDLRPAPDDAQGWTTDLAQPKNAPKSGPPTSQPRSKLYERMMADDDPKALERAFDGYPSSGS